MTSHAQPHLFPNPITRDLYRIENVDAFEWLRARAPNSIHAVVTDPPYGLLEYTEEQKTNFARGKGEFGGFPQVSTAANGDRCRALRS
jgi:DNA modification methylase